LLESNSRTAPSISSLYSGQVTVEFDPGVHRYLVTDSGNGLVSSPCPSVTTVIGCLDKSNGLVPWACNEMGRRVLELLKASTPDSLQSSWHLAWCVEHAKETWRKTRQIAADIGTAVHTVLEQELLFRSGLGSAPTLPLQSDDPIAVGLKPFQIKQANNAIDAGRRYFDEHQIEILQTESPRYSREYEYIGTGDLIAVIDGLPSVLDFKTSKKLYNTVWLQTAAYQQAWQEEFPEQPLVQRVGLNVRKDGLLEPQKRDNSLFTEDLLAFTALLTVHHWRSSPA
jgi:hypothetical protein